MRQGSVLPSVMVGMLSLGIFLYLILSFWESLTDTYTSTIAYPYTVSDSVDAKGVIVREEVLLPPASGLLDVLRTEGEQVGVGQAVGRVYRDVSAMQEQNQLEALVEEAEVLAYALEDKMDIITVSKMDEDIVLAISALRGATAAGNYQNLEEQLVKVQGNVLRRDYVFGDAMVNMEMEHRYESVVAQINNFSQGNSGTTSYVTTPVSGAYSILVDGLENLTVDEVMDYSMEDLNRLLEYSAQGVDQGTGKIITGDTWYFLTSLATEWAKDLWQGQGMTVRFSGDFSQDITMVVEEVGEDEDGMCLLLLSSDRYLEQSTLLRIQTVELVYQNYSGLRVPKEAMRMVAWENEETGEVKESYGVYVLSAGYAEFKTAVILAEGKDFYVVEAGSEGANALRAGNEIVVNAVGIYHGKLLEY